MVRKDDGRAKKKTKVTKLVAKRFPIINWLRGYTPANAVSDLIAGITLGLTMIPQSIAYAALAGLTPQDGLNSSFIGCIIYAFFGTIKEVIIGPTSLMALLTYQYTSHLSMDFVVLLAFLCGVVEFFMGILHLGFLVELISAPVVSGFTTATSLIIIVSQLKGLLGLSFKADGILDTLMKIYQSSNKIRPGDTLLGLIVITCLLSLRKLKEVKLREGFPCRAFLKKLFWTLSTGRNAIAVFITALVALHYKSQGSKPPFITTKSGSTSLPSLQLPPFSTTDGNRTYSFTEMVVELGSGPVVIPIVSVLANVAIAKAFVNGAVDATQEMLTLSLCNLAGSVVQAMPTTGAFTRSAVAGASGIRTPIAGIYADHQLRSIYRRSCWGPQGRVVGAGLTLCALGFLGPYFHYIPRATLSAILIAAVIFLIDWQIVKYLWKKSWLDLFTVGLTLLTCLAASVEFGLLVGVIVGLSHLIYKWARPNILVEVKKREGETTVRVTPLGGLYFPAVDYFASTVNKAGLHEGMAKCPVVVDCRYFSGTDYTVAKGIISMKTAFDKRGQPMWFENVPKNCYKIWTGSGCKKDYFALSDHEYSIPRKYSEHIDVDECPPSAPEVIEEEELLNHPYKDSAA